MIEKINQNIEKTTEENFCPICGNDMTDIAGTNFPGIDKQHKCPKKILAGIDAAHTNALLNDFNMGDFYEKTYHQRLSAGFKITGDYEEISKNCKEVN